MALDIFQQVFSLSLAANWVNVVDGNQASLQRAFQLALASEVPLIGAGWQLVWGPVVLKTAADNDQTGPENSCYVAFHPRLRFEDGSLHPTYVVAVAGTPKTSLNVWKKNLAVHTVTDIRAWVAGGVRNCPEVVPKRDIKLGGAYIASGTVKTVHSLLTTAPPKGAASAGTTLLDFITANIGKRASPRFIATGYSLGGAVAPSLALSLVLAGYIPPDHTLTYPIAGPSPGSSGLTDLFVQIFPPRYCGRASYQGWNLNLVNKLDVVPQAWCISQLVSPEQNLGNVPAIYGKPTMNLVRHATRLAKSWSAISCVLYKPLPGRYFSGTRPAYTPNKLTEFMKIARQQHEEAYFQEVGVLYRCSLGLRSIMKPTDKSYVPFTDFEGIM